MICFTSRRGSTRHSPRIPLTSLSSTGAAAGCYCAALAILLAGCASPSPTGGDDPASESAALRGDPARLTFGATESQARAGKTSSFSLEGTPDLVLHAALASTKYSGKTLLVRGFDPHGELAWSYPHAQQGAAFDIVLPVFGSPAARRHVAGAYRFEVTAPDATILAKGSATLTSEHNMNRGGAVTGGGT
jgi:hypothetical protein